MGRPKIQAMHPRRLLLIGPLFALGCGAQNEPGNKSLTPSDFINQYAQNVCAGVSPACLLTMDACTSIQIDDRSRKAQAAADKGWSLVPDAAQTCLRLVGSLYGSLKNNAVVKAADFKAMEQACDQVYRGPRTVNAICELDADCTPGLICDKFYCGTKTVVPQGAGCANIGETCPAGSYCAVLAEGLRTCAPKIGLGGACNVSTPCLEALRCPAGVCAVQLGIGEKCTVDQDCASQFCEPYLYLCADDVRFANHSAACVAMGGQ
jgi:hypothetical protein